MVFSRWLSLVVLGALAAGTSAAGTSLAGCGASVPALAARPPPPPSAVERLSAGASVAVTRPTPGIARLALWLDVGTRDSAAPQLSTAAAWWVSERAQLEARVLPDAIELSTTCDLRSESLDACVKRLVRGFVAPAPSEADAERLRGRLREARMRALTVNDRVIERQALDALFGVQGRALSPFGDDEGDAQLDSKSIAAFVQQHMHAGRALLVGVGDVEGQTLARAWKGASPRRGLVAKTHRNTLPAASSLAITQGPSAQLSFALSVPSSAMAAAIARDFVRIYDFGRAHVVRLRGHNVLLVTMPAGDEAWKRLQRAAFDLRRLALEAKPRTAPPRGESLLELSAEIGEEWAARGQPSLEFPEPWPLGIAVTMRETPHALTTEQATSAKQEEWLKFARAAVERGEALARGENAGKVSATRAEVHTENGVRIRVERRAGARFMSAFVRFSGGSRDDPTEHGGRAALLATTLANGCGFSDGAALDARLLALDARLTPMVSPSAFGARVVAPNERTEVVVDTLLRCALRPALDARSIEDARLRLLSSLHANEASLYEAFAARALDAETPGTYTSWGTPRGVAAVSAAELRRAHETALVGRRMDIAVVADAEPRVIAQFIARRVGHLESGKVATPPPVRINKPSLIGERTRVRSPRAIVSLGSNGEQSSKVASAAVSKALGEALAARTGRLVWSDAGASENASWAAVALEVAENDLDAFSQKLTGVLGELRRKTDAFWKLRLARSSRDELVRLSTAEGAAERMFYQAAGTPGDAALLARVHALLASPEGVAILRPGR